MDGRGSTRTTTFRCVRLDAKRKLLWILLVLWCACALGYLLAPTGNLVELMDDGVKRVALTPGQDIRSVITPTSLPRAPYAPWVHGFWVSSSLDGAAALLSAYTSRHMPIDAIILSDDFLFAAEDDDGMQRAKLIRLKALVGTCANHHGNPVHVVVSVDGVIPQASKWFHHAQREGYLIDNGAVIATSTRGDAFTRVGGVIDFTNTQALHWFEALLSPILKLGVDGVFNEATDAAYALYALDRATASGVHAGARALDVEVFAARYYYEMFDFGRQVSGFDFVTVFRPVDSASNIMFRAFGPQDISLSTIVSGNRRECTFVGLKDAALHVLHSADRGYINIGLSTCSAATSNRSMIESELLLRWAQLSAFTSLMELGGSGETAAPWEACSRDNNGAAGPSQQVCLDGFQRMVRLHRELWPYLHAQGSLTFLHKISDERRKKPSSLNPTSETRTVNSDAPFVIQSLHTQNFLFHDPDSWDYLLGPDLFVAPVLNRSDTNGVSSRSVRFPHQGQWVPFKHAAVVRVHSSNHNDDISSAPSVFAPRTATMLDVDGSDILVFQRRGSIVPLETQLLPGGLTFVVAYPHMIRQSALAAKYVPPALRDQYIPLMEDKRTADGVEFAVVFGEHDHGMVLSYSTRRSETNKNQFFIDLRATPYHKTTLVHLQHVRCDLDCQATSSFKENGYRGYSTKDAFFDQGVKDVGARAVFVGNGDIFLFDPFSSLGSTTSIGPLATQ